MNDEFKDTFLPEIDFTENIDYNNSEPENTISITDDVYVPQIQELYNLEIKMLDKKIEIDNLRFEGNNVISTEHIDTSQWPSIFELTIKKDNEIVLHYDYAKLLQQMNYDWDNENYYLTFSPIQSQIIETMKVKSDVEYIAMMTDIEIE